jgi:energy-converting hydrogenase Eha subunit B
MSGLNQTATPQPVVDFVPQKQYPSFSSIINESVSIAAYTGTATTLLYSDVLGGFITSNNASAQTLTLPTAALLVPQIEGAQVGSAIRFFVKELGAGTATVAAGTGGTVTGTATIATLNIKEFLLVVTAIGASPTYTAYSLGTSVY